MFTKGNTVYSEAFSYLKKGNAVSLKGTGSMEDFMEIDFNLPLKVEVKNKMVKIGTYFIAKPINFSYGSVKTAVVKMRYSNDDQMAIILNKDKSEEDAMLYKKMQDWRDFASEVAKLATQND